MRRMTSRSTEIVKGKNVAKCAVCDDIIESFTRHDFVSCLCGSIYRDGGQDYWRCGGDFNLHLDVTQEEYDRFIEAKFDELATDQTRKKQ